MRIVLIDTTQPQNFSRNSQLQPYTFITRIKTKGINRLLPQLFSIKLILAHLVQLLDATADSMRGTIQVELMMDSR